METRLILVDGMPGTGKSTMAQFIHGQLVESGRSSTWQHEEVSHPVRAFYDAEQHGSWAGYAEAVLFRWGQYAQTLKGLDQIAVFDAVLLQTYVRSGLIFDMDRSAIIELVRTIAQVIAPLSPTFIYLKPNSVEQNYRDVVQSRGKKMLDLWIEAHAHYPYTLRSSTSGYEAFIGFWNEFDQIADTIHGQLSMRRLLQRASRENWDDRSSLVCEFLGVPQNTTAPPASELGALAGSYVPLNDDSLPGFRLEVRDGDLIALVENPTYDPTRTPIVRFAECRLLPAEANSFFLAGWPYVLQFKDGFRSGKQAIVQREDATETGEVFVKQQPP